MSEAPAKPGILSRMMRPPWRTVWPATLLVLVMGIGYLEWSPGATVTNGRHDLGQNGIWLQHGWLGHDSWFEKYNKIDRIDSFRDTAQIRELVSQLKRDHITDLFPHVAPTQSDGQLPPIDRDQVERFLDECDGLRVMPWIGGASGVQAHPEDADWRANFVRSIRVMLDTHPRMAGVHINIEPCPSGTRDFIDLLKEVRAVLEQDEVLSIAAYPPPTRWHPYPEVHWEEAYFREVAGHVDQVAVMMYDTALTRPRFYEALMRDWTVEILDWSGNAEVLLGLPTYDDADTDYHDPDTENLQHAIAGIHAGLLEHADLPDNYKGVALYSEWEMQSDEWAYYREHFLKP